MKSRLWAFAWIWFICGGTVSVQAATMTQTESWSLFSGPSDAQAEETRSISAFDPSLGMLTQVDWSVDAGIDAAFSVAPTSFPIDYSFSAGILCGVAFPIGSFGCDLAASAGRFDSRVGGTLPVSGPMGVAETISLGFSNVSTFTDPTLLAVFTGTTPIGLTLAVDTSAQAQTCIPDPFNVGQQICTPHVVAYSGDYAGTLAVTYTFAPVPIPAAVWLFGSGLLGLIGVARRMAA